MTAAAGLNLGQLTRPASYGLPPPGSVRVEPNTDELPLQREPSFSGHPGLCQIAERHGVSLVTTYWAQ